MNAVLPVPPSANRLWRRSGARIHKAQAYTDWQEAALWALREQVGPSIEPTFGDVGVALVLAGRVRIDLDNAIKPALDLLQHAGILTNDRQVGLLDVRRMRSEEDGRLELSLWPLDPAYPA